jgi:hypothetical protein
MPSRQTRNAAIYAILFYREDRLCRQVPWELGLESAKIYARDHMAVRKADRAEVHDETGSAVFCCTASEKPCPTMGTCTLK